MTTLDNCPLCNSGAISPDLVCKDYTVSQETFNITICDSCGFKFTNPRPDNNVLGDYYKSESYISHSDTKKGVIAKLYHFIRSYTLQKKVELISRYVSRGTVLDYGCGTGMFLDACKKKGWVTYGIEPDSGARKIASEMGLRVFENRSSLLSEITDIKVDVITLWHVLEHITDLSDALSFFKQKLNENGILVIAVPNYKSYDARYYKEYWAAYDVPRHLYHFEKSTISSLLDQYGFSLTNCFPMKFDSFYVSMLSENHKTGSIRYFRSFLTGLKSNLMAQSSEDYSSVIYVFKRI